MGKAVLGGLMAIAGTAILFFNEGRAVKTARSLAEGAAAVVSVDADQLSQQHEGKLIHLSGRAAATTALVDDRFGVSAEAIRLIRTVEVFQWKEIEEKVTRKVDGKSKTETEYSYEQVWDSMLHATSNFREPTNHQNPPPRFEHQEVDAEEVLVGEYRLPQDLVGQLTDAQPIEVSLATVPEDIADGLRIDGGTETSAAGFYWSADPETTEPQIGDVRVRFSAVFPTTVSVIAQQSDSRLQPFKTRNGREISMIRPGEFSAEKMFDDAQAQNTAMTWALRLAGTIGLIAGIGFVLQPLTSITQRIPVICNLVGMGAAFVAMLLGGAVALLTISFAWLLYRPLIAVPLIIVGVFMLVLVARFLKRRSDEPDVSRNVQNV